jgi:hypothetical protein
LLDLTLLDFFLWGLMEEVTNRTIIDMREEHLYWVNCGLCVKTHKKIKQAVDSCLKWAMLHIVNYGRDFEQYKMCLKNRVVN